MVGRLRALEQCLAKPNLTERTYPDEGVKTCYVVQTGDMRDPL